MHTGLCGNHLRPPTHPASVAIIDVPKTPERHDVVLHLAFDTLASPLSPRIDKWLALAKIHHLPLN